MEEKTVRKVCGICDRERALAVKTRKGNGFGIGTRWMYGRSFTDGLSQTTIINTPFWRGKFCHDKNGLIIVDLGTGKIK